MAIVIGFVVLGETLKKDYFLCLKNLKINLGSYEWCLLLFFLSPNPLWELKHANRYPTNENLERLYWPELLLKKALWQAGVRYKSPKKHLPDKPDISLKKYKLFIFVYGAFWHTYTWGNRKQAIKYNEEFLIAKIEWNLQPDLESNTNYEVKRVDF